MAEKSVSFNVDCNLRESYTDAISRWLSCNGEAWGVGPTALFAAAAALFLHHELEAAVFVPGDGPHASVLEKILIWCTVAGMLALMVHVWVCLMRFFQYYLDTLIRDSPNVLLEMTTAGLLGAGAAGFLGGGAGAGGPQLVALGPLARFLRQQQPQLHITACWFLALCYADYVRKHYCSGFNLPYLEQWQVELQEQAQRRVRGALAAVDSLAGALQARLRGCVPPPPPPPPPGPLSAVDSVASWAGRGGCGGGAGGCVGGGPARACAAGETFEKLRAYIQATRCSCSAADSCGGVPAAAAPSTPAAPATPATPATPAAAATPAVSAAPSGAVARADESPGLRPRAGSLPRISDRHPPEHRRTNSM